MASINHVCPLLPAADVAKSAAWYRDKLGFAIAGVFPNNGYAIIKRDDVEIHFWGCSDSHIARNTSAYFRPDDLDALYGEMKRASEGGKISDIEERDWGMREFYVWDPDGNLLRFGVDASTRAAE